MSEQPETQAKGTEAANPQEQPASTQKETSSSAKAEIEGSERRFSQEELDEKVERRLGKERRKYERELEELKAEIKKMQPKPEAKPKEPEAKEATGNDQQQDTELQERLIRLEQENAEQKATNLFNETLQEAGLQPSKAQRKRLRKLFDPEDPEDILDVAKDFNIPGVGEEPKETKEAGKQAEEEGEPEEKKGEGPAHLYRDPGAPRGGDDHNEVNATKWTPEQIERMKAEGKLLERAKQFRSTLRGGDGGLFRKKVPKVT